MKDYKTVLKRILFKHRPAGDLPFFISIASFAVILLFAVSYKSAFLLRMALVLAFVSFFYATIWLSVCNRYISEELEKIKKHFSVEE